MFSFVTLGHALRGSRSWNLGAEVIGPKAHDLVASLPKHPPWDWHIYLYIGVVDLGSMYVNMLVPWSVWVRILA